MSLSITRLGLEFLAATLLVGAFGVNTGNNLLYLVFSLMVALFLVSGWVSRMALLAIEPTGIEEGSLFARVRGGLRLRLREAAPARIRGLELHLELDHAHVEPGFLSGGSGEKEPQVVVHVRPSRRGWAHARTLELRTRYPFGFLEKAWRFNLDQPVLIFPHPRIVALRPGPKGETQRALPRPGAAEPEGIRPFRAGDPVSRVHWKRTAQRGAPWVRTLEDESPAGLHLHLDLRAHQPGPAFEAELERLSGAILQARIQKRTVSLEVHTKQGRQEVEGHLPCWRMLALAEAQGAFFEQ